MMLHQVLQPWQLQYQLGLLRAGTAAIGSLWSARALASKRRPVQEDETFTLEACMTKVAAVAEPNSVCPKQHQTALEAVAAAMPNSYWLFVECGNWGPSHPQAGSPARAVLHTLLYTQGLSADPQLCTQLDSLHGCFYTWNAYMLDSTGWPNSLIYRDIGELEYLSTKASSRKPALSIHVLLRQKRCTLENWAKVQLKKKGAERMPQSHIKLMRGWYRDTVAGMGIQVADSPLSS